MRKSTYLVIASNTSKDKNQNQQGAEIATQRIIAALVSSGERVIIAGPNGNQLASEPPTGAEVWQLGEGWNLDPVWGQVQALGQFHLIKSATSPSISKLESDSRCLSKIEINSTGQIASTATSDAPAATSAPAAIKILMQNRSSAFTHPGGDTVLMERTAEGLRELGYQVTIDTEGKADPSQFSLVHLFNFATPDITKLYAEKAAKAGTPFVVTTLCEDVASFHNRSRVWAAVLAEYVKRGQDKEWFNANSVMVNNVQSSGSFDNAWVASKAAALIANGPGEARLLTSQYPGAKVVSVPVGFDAPKSGNPHLFVQKYGIKDFILCVGRLESRKNQLALLKALESSELPVVLVSGGVCYQPEYTQAANNFKRKGQTLIVERLSPEMLASAYAACRVHALVSWHELPGLVSLEAAWNGKNVVAVDCGTTRDYLGDYAFYCEPSNPASILNACLAAYYTPANPEFRRSIERYSWSNAAKATASVYQELLSQGASRVVESSAVSPSSSSVEIAAPSRGMAATPIGASAIKATSAPKSAPEQEKAQDLLVEAEKLAGAGQYEQAIEKVKRVLDMEPRNSWATRSLGAIMLAKGDNKQALEQFKSATKLDPSDARCWVGLGLAMMSEGDFRGAMTQLGKALKIKPDQLVALRALIECSYKENEFSVLEEALVDYVTKHPADDEMRFCLAGCLFKVGKIKESAAMNNDVLGRNPQHRGALELNALLEKENSQATQAAAQLSKQVEVIYDQNDQQLTELEEMKRQGKFSEVLEGLDQLLQGAGLRKEQTEQASLIRAESLVLTGQLRDAREIFEKIIAANPNAARAVCGMAALEAHAGRWGEAKALFQKALTMKPDYDVPYAGLGLCSIQEKDLTTAWENFWQATQVNPENTRALVGLIEVGYQQKRYVDLEKALRGYLDLHPADVEFIYSLAGCLFAQGKYDSARTEAEKIFLFDSDHRDARELVEMINRKQGDRGRVSL